MVSMTWLWEKVKIRMGGIISSTAAAAPTPTREIPPSLICRNMVGSTFRDSS